MNADLKYPIGRFTPQPYSLEQKKAWILDLQFLATALERAIINLDEAQLNTPYREGGWNVKQVVHHLADSHMNAYFRIKLAITEDKPTIKPYNENAWAELPDNDMVPINVSITLLHALHIRLVATLKELTEEQFERLIFHPANNREISIWNLMGIYAWHGNHHVAHITNLRERNNW
jgi:hypothetical protein